MIQNTAIQKTDKAKELGIPIIVYTTTQELDSQLKSMKIINAD